MATDIDRLVATMLRTLPLDRLALGDEYRYAHLSLALVDAVFSVGITYTTTQRVVSHYARTQGLTLYRVDEAEWPAIGDQEPLDALIALANSRGTEGLARDVFKNYNRTSSINGILKADAVVRAARLLRAHHVQYFQDLPRVFGNEQLERAFRSIPGQQSGLSWDYFWMLVGTERLIKPDRHVLQYLRAALGRPINADEAQDLVEHACRRLANQYPNATPRRLDYAMWQWQKSHGVQAGGGAPKDSGSSPPPSGRLSAKAWIRGQVRNTGGVRLEDGVAAGYQLITLQTALSDLKNPKYCGVGGVLILQRGSDGIYRPSEADPRG
jgi:hypothetical protein